MDANWDHLRTFEAVARLGSLSAAAKALGASQSTVSRHIAQLESIGGSPLFLRQVPIQLTTKGEAVLRAVQAMVSPALTAQSALEDRQAIYGEVSLSTVGELVRWHLAPALPALQARHPGLRLRLLSDNRVTSLATGEADLALRFARPERGDLVGRRVHREHYDWYASARTGAAGTGWLGLAGSLSNIPEQRHAERVMGRPASALIEDVEALGRAVEAGAGIAVLPMSYAASLDVKPVDPTSYGAASAPEIAPRDLWLVMHQSRRRLPRVRAVVDWIDSLFTRPA